MKRVLMAAIILAGTAGIRLTVHEPTSAQGVTCGSFASQREAQSYFDNNGGPAELDPDGNGIACESIAQDPPIIDDPTATATLAPLPTDTPTFIATATATDAPVNPESEVYSCTQYGAMGYTYQQIYDDLFAPAGGPERDPYSLDGDGDGYPCENLPGHPRDASTAPQYVYGRNGNAGTRTATPTRTTGVTATPRTTAAPGRSGSPSATAPNVRANPVSTATSPTTTGRARSGPGAATNTDDPDYTLGQLDAWLAMEAAAGETIRTGMADPAFTDAAWYVEQSSAVGTILAAHTQMQAIEPLTTLRDVTTQVQTVSATQATAAGYCDTALVSNTAEDATRCLDAVERSTNDVVALRAALQSWDGASLDYEPST